MVVSGLTERPPDGDGNEITRSFYQSGWSGNWELDAVNWHSRSAPTLSSYAYHLVGIFAIVMLIRGDHDHIYEKIVAQHPRF